jgi:hypothetical protein
MDMTLQLHQNYIFALTINVFIISSSLSRVDHATYNICFVVKVHPWKVMRLFGSADSAVEGVPGVMNRPLIKGRPRICAFGGDLDHYVNLRPPVDFFIPPDTLMASARSPSMCSPEGYNNH